MIARQARIEGDVLVRITTDGETVIEAKAESGPEMLRKSSEDCAITWKFAAHTPGTFHVVFRWILGDGKEVVIFPEARAVVAIIETREPMIETDNTSGAVQNDVVTRQKMQTSLQDELVGLEKQSWVAWKGRDSKFFERFLADDHVEMGFSGPATKAVVAAGVASPNCTVKSYTVDDFKVVVLSAESAVVTYHAAQDTTCNGRAVPSPVWVTSTFVKRGGRWLNAVYQQTQDSRKK